MTAEEFNSLPAVNKRLVIAQDVISNLLSGKIIARVGGYIKNPDLSDGRIVENKEGVRNWQDARVDWKGKELQELIETAPEPCEVCGIGSLFICDIMKRDNYTLDLWNGVSGIEETHIQSKLADYFIPTQLNLIECAFEKWVVNDDEDILQVTGEDKYGDSITVPSELGAKAISFGHQHIDPKDRLIAIMENLIENGGEFLP